MIRHGLTLSCLGDAGAIHYKKSRRGNAEIDRAAAHILKSREHVINEFVPWGYDERQYCSPGFNLPVGAISRTPNGKFSEYHTSLDNLDLISRASLEDSLETIWAIINVLDANCRPVNLMPMCEPQLGKRGLYFASGGGEQKSLQMAMLWVLNQADGSNDLIDIADRSGHSVSELSKATSLLRQAKLVGA